MGDTGPALSSVAMWSPARKATRQWLTMLAIAGCTACGPAPDAVDTAPPTTPPPSVDDVLPGEWEKGYEPHALVPGETTPETSPPTPVNGGKATQITLSDGTKLDLPALTPKTGDGPLTSLTLGRESNTVELTGLDHQTTGSMRVVTFDAFDPVARGLVAANVAPVLTIPAKEVGKIDHATVNVARVAEMMDSGQLTRTVMMLPTTWDAAGNLVFRDYLFPDSVATALEIADTGGVATAARQPATAGYVPRPRRITYVVGTFQTSMNWARTPKLVRMVPTGDVPEMRKPLERLDATKRAEVEKRCFNTAVILVHGHNEEEGLGFAPATVDDPWIASYKRDVWTHLYEQAASMTPTDCVRYYELVYPTYRPIFTPQPSGRERLDQSLARLALTELKPQLDAKVPIQVVLVAHSMGGLVARSGVQLFEQSLQASLKEVITWGSPHTGSPLVTLRYTLAAVPGYDARSGLVGIGLDNVDQTLYAFRRAVENTQVDSPGTRDLRWAPSATTTARDLALDSFFELSPDQVSRDQFFDLVNGEWLYNANLTKLNGEDIYRNDPRYVALFGTTTKRARITWKFGKWFRPTIDVGSDIAIGATVLSWLVKDPTSTYAGAPVNASDGAVSLTSMAGAGVVPLAGARSEGDIDHEEYFGAPTAPGTFTKRDLALRHAQNTFYAHKFSACPPLYAHFQDELWEGPYRWELTGTFSWPDSTDAARLLNAGAGARIRVLPSGPDIVPTDFKITPAGAAASILGVVPPEAIPTGIWDKQLRVSLTLVDGTLAIADISPDSGCVTPETLVTMGDGSRRPIEAVERGDVVAAFEPGLPGRRVDATVERVLRHDGAFPIHRLVAGGGVELEVTGNHPILTLEGGYQPASILEPGDTIFVLDPSTERFEPRPIVAVVKDVSQRGVVYNLKTTRGQYVAADVVLHNKCLAAGSVVDTPSGARAVEALRPGDVVWTLAHGSRVPTTVTHAYAKTTVLPALPGRVLTERVRVTDNHALVGANGSLVRAGDADLPASPIAGTVYDIATAAGTYLADGVLVRGGE